MFRRSTAEFLWWRESLIGMKKQLGAQREHTEKLLHSAVSPLSLFPSFSLALPSSLPLSLSLSLTLFSLYPPPPNPSL